MIREEISKIIDEYAAMVDDDNTFFVKPEDRKPYVDRLLSLFKKTLREMVGKKEKAEDGYFESIKLDNRSFILGKNNLRMELLEKIEKL